MVPLNATKVSTSESLGEATIDSCGRIWMIAYNFGIRIYDRSGTVLVGTWTLSDGLGNMLLLDTYELCVTDYDRGYIYRFNPNLQCTS